MLLSTKEERPSIVKEKSTKKIENTTSTKSMSEKLYQRRHLIQANAKSSKFRLKKDKI